MKDGLFPLEGEIRRRIRLAGPIPVAEYMTLCLSHPEHGYYVTRDPLGASGDFTTSPEIGQVFGELLGLWAATVWQQMGAPAEVNLVELGPGRGTLMADALRATRKVAGFHEALRVHLVEMSPVLRQRQQQALEKYALPLAWHGSLTDAPDGRAIVLANEFYDALPVHQAVKQNGAWFERMVGIDDAGRFAFTLATSPLLHFERFLPPAVREAADGAMFEWRSDSAALELGRRVMRGAGAALVIDYGHVASATGETLQAVGNHAYADPLVGPGLVDLTAHVDFEALARAAGTMGATAHGPVDQGDFLQRLGIDQRTATLRRNATPDQARQIETASLRLTAGGRAGMGRLFKVLGLGHPDLGVLPGFET